MQSCNSKSEDKDVISACYPLSGLHNSWAKTSNSRSPSFYARNYDTVNAELSALSFAFYPPCLHSHKHHEACFLADFALVKRLGSHSLKCFRCKRWRGQNPQPFFLCKTKNWSLSEASMRLQQIRLLRILSYQSLLCMKFPQHFPAEMYWSDSIKRRATLAPEQGLSCCPPSLTLEIYIRKGSLLSQYEQEEWLKWAAVSRFYRRTLQTWTYPLQSVHWEDFYFVHSL